MSRTKTVGEVFGTRRNLLRLGGLGLLGASVGGDRPRRPLLLAWRGIAC